MQRFEAYEDISGNWRWRLWAGEDEIVACSGEAYSSQASALRAAEAVQAAAPDAAISIAPGLGIRAAQRFRALLAGDDAGPGHARSGGARPRPLRAVRGTSSSALVRIRPAAGTRTGS